MKYAVTTASGKLGSTISQQLINDVGKENALGIARTPEKANFLGIEIRRGDYDSQDSFEQALLGVDAVLIVSSNGDPAKRIQQHRNIIEAAKRCQVKKIVYTSIVGDPNTSKFSPVVRSNRQSEKDVANSGLNYAIGRNGLYIEPDLEYVDHYAKAGEIANSADDGLCAYTSRKELAVAYSHLLQEEQHNGKIYNLVGEAITQERLTEIINHVYGLNLVYRSIPVEEYLRERKAALGEFLGTIIAGIYEGIKNGAFNVPSHFKAATGRDHQSAFDMINTYKD